MGMHVNMCNNETRLRYCDMAQHSYTPKAAARDRLPTAVEPARRERVAPLIDVVPLTPLPGPVPHALV
eukprot:6099983-Alexandrium_andersonii.AAC.1